MVSSCFVLNPKKQKTIPLMTLIVNRAARLIKTLMQIRLVMRNLSNSVFMSTRALIDAEDVEESIKKEERDRVLADVEDLCRHLTVGEKEQEIARACIALVGGCC